MMRFHQHVVRSLRSAMVLLALPIVACGDSGTGPPPDAGILWSFAAPGLGEPAADDSTVYFGGMQNEVVALDRATGEIRWRSSTTSGLPQTFGGTNVILAGDVAVFGDAAIHAFDRATGERRWIFAGVDSATYTRSLPGLSRLASDGSRIFAGSTGGRAYALSLVDGSPYWETQVGDAYSDAVMDAFVSGGTVFYVVLHDDPPSGSEIVALDAATGQEKWRRSFGASGATQLFLLGPVAVTGSTVAFGDIHGAVHAVDAATGNDLWEVPAAAGQEGKDHGRWVIAVGDELVAVGGGGDITALDPATGTERWSATASEAGVFGPISSDGGAIYVLFDNQRKLGAYDASTGKELWLISPPGGAQRFGGLPLVESDAIFVASSSALLALER